MIEFNNFSFRYEEQNDFTLKNISLSIQPGKFVLLTGRSGCGKTTLIRVLNGLIPHFYPGESKGDVWLDKKSLMKQRPSDLAGIVGTVFQDPRSQFFMTDTTRELAFGCENMGFDREETLERVAKAVSDLELIKYLNRSIFELSSGEKQQIAIGSVYALTPDVYIFDEPSANLDYDATKRLTKIMQMLKETGRTVIVVEHRFYYLRDLIDQVILLQHGCVEQIFERETFLNMPESIRIHYGLRTAFPEREQTVHMDKHFFKEQERVLSVKNLNFAYKKRVNVLQNINFEVHGGDIIGILGHNGVGKTTLLSIVTGLLKENRGEIRYNGKKLSPHERRKLSYMVMQDTDYQLFASSVGEELSLGIKGECAELVEDTLRSLELKDYKETHPAALSGGQKQRVTIGAAIVKDSPILFFDEPTSGLDYDAMIRVSGLISELSKKGGIIFVVSHDFEFIARTCTEILQLDRRDLIYKETLTPEVLLSFAKQYFS